MRHFVAASILLLSIAACDDDPRDTGAGHAGRDSVAVSDSGSVGDSTKPISTNLPSGRFELPTPSTNAPDLWITLPSGYQVKNGTDGAGDSFYVLRSDDPSLRDSSVDSPAFMRVYVGPKAQHPFGGVKTDEGARVMIAGYPLQWRVGDEAEGTKGRFFRRDIGSADLFARFSPELAKEPLHFHVFVAGADLTRVAELMQSAESISIVP